MKIKFISTVLLLSMAFLPNAYPETLDRVVAVVNDEVITQSELDSMLHPFYVEYRKRFSGEELIKKLNEVRQKILNQLIEDKLVYQEAVRREIPVRDTEIEEEIKIFKERFGSEEEFQKAMDEEGMTLTKLKERFRRRIAVRRLHYFEIHQKVIVSPGKVERYFEEHKGEFAREKTLSLKTITIRKDRKNPENNEQIREKAEQILKDLREGADFAEIARAHSEDSYAAEGGEFGEVTRGSLAPEIDKAVFTTEEGELTPIIETAIGYHIFKVVKVNPARQSKLEEVREKIKGLLYKEKLNERFNEFMGELKEEAYITIR